MRARISLVLAVSIGIGISACDAGDYGGGAGSEAESEMAGEAAPDEAQLASEAMDEDGEHEAASEDGYQGKEIAWQYGDVDSAFAQAQATGRPVFMYWGAEWCPPCHYLKEKVFKTESFQTQVANFVPVYLDGDTEDAQTVGEQYSVTGYPTVVIFNAEGAEVTRMTSFISPESYADTLASAMQLAQPIAETFRSVMETGPAAASPEQLRLLAFYSWGQDQEVGLEAEDRYDTFRQLYDETPADLRLVRSRFLTEFIGEAIDRAEERASEAEEAGTTAEPVFSPEESASYQQAMLDLLADPEQRAANLIFVYYYSRETVELFQPEVSAERDAFMDAWLTAAQAIEDDESMPAYDRLSAIWPRLHLADVERADLMMAEAGLDGASVESSEGSDSDAATEAGGETDAEAEEEEDALPEELVAHVRDRVTWAGETVTDEGELQAVLNLMASLMNNAGLADEAAVMIEQKMAGSLSPHYFMDWLAYLAENAEDPEAAVDWARKAWEAAEGRASRFQWGYGYVQALVDNAPDQAELIESTSIAVLEELLTTPDAFANRNNDRLGRLQRALEGWNEEGAQDETLTRIRSVVTAACSSYASEAELAMIAAEGEEASEDGAASDAASDDAASGDASEGEGETEADTGEGDDESVEADTPYSRCSDFLLPVEPEAATE